MRLVRSHLYGSKKSRTWANNLAGSASATIEASAMPPDSQNSVAVIHSTNIWLTQTMTWKYTQIKLLPEDITSCVVCDHTTNIEQFPFENLISIDRDTPVWRWLCGRSWQIRRLRRAQLIVQQARKYKAAVLHSHFGTQAWFDLEHATRNGLKHVATFYGYDATRTPALEPIWRSRYQELFEAIDLCLCEGPYLGGTIAKLGCPDNKIKVHHLGVDLTQLPYRPRTWHSGEPLMILIAGAFVEKKGIPDALEALARISGCVDLEITLVGDQNGQERSQVEKERIFKCLKNSGLSAHTKMVGFQSHSALIGLAYENHVFLSPSVIASDGDAEGGAPVSIIEMAATGMPVVSTFHCDIPEVLHDGVSGLLAPEKNVEAIASKLIWLTENPDQWTRITDAARNRIEAEFNAVIQGERLAAIYRSLF